MLRTRTYRVTNFKTVPSVKPQPRFGKGKKGPPFKVEIFMKYQSGSKKKIKELSGSAKWEAAAAKTLAETQARLDRALGYKTYIYTPPPPPKRLLRIPSKITIIEDIVHAEILATGDRYYIVERDNWLATKPVGFKWTYPLLSCGAQCGAKIRARRALEDPQSSFN